MARIKKYILGVSLTVGIATIAYFISMILPEGILGGTLVLARLF